MIKLVLAAGLLLAVTPYSFAQDFNPGTVVGNVFQNPLSGCGYGYGLGCNPPSNDQGRRLAYRHQVRRQAKHDMPVQR
jgi:hypothetical protein